MAERDQNLINADLRQRTMLYMFQGGATVEYVTDVLRKLYKHDKEDWDEKFLEEEVMNWFETSKEGGERPQKSVQAEVEDWLSSHTSNKACYQDVTCSLLVCYSDLGYKTIKEKGACRMAFKRLVERGKLEPLRDRSGMYRYMNGKMEEIDFLNADATPFPIKFPLGVHELVETYKKSLIVLAGEPNAGKTAFLLNLAWKNRDEEPNYFSTDMGAAELQIRLKKFPHALTDWKKIKFIAKSEGFKDVINPDGLNIIDYLEVSKDFFEIGGMLTDIYNNLKEGVAVVAIQKPPGRDVGVGGARTLDKARLYLAIEPGILKIVKGKLWRQDCVNPNGMFVKWTLAGGASFKIMPNPDNGDDWRRA
jgi:hypothetical protein